MKSPSADFYSLPTSTVLLIELSVMAVIVTLPNEGGENDAVNFHRSVDGVRNFSSGCGSVHLTHSQGSNFTCPKEVSSLTLPLTTRFSRCVR